jgi:CBS domain-containing protein
MCTVSNQVVDGAPTAARLNLRDEKIKVISRHEPILIESGSSLAEAINAMQQARGDCVLVCEGRRLVGILTERDVLNKVLGREVNLEDPVNNFITQSPDTLTLQDTVGQALEMMDQGGYRNVPLCSDSGEVSGLLRSQDILEYVAEAFPQEVLNLPPRPHQTMEEPEGA